MIVLSNNDEMLNHFTNNGSIHTKYIADKKVSALKSVILENGSNPIGSVFIFNFENTYFSIF